MSLKNKIPIFSQILQSILLVLLVGFTPLISLWNQNLDQIQSEVVLKPLFITLIIIIIINCIWLVVSRSLKKSALLTSVTLIFFFTFGHLYNLIEGKTLMGLQIGYVKLLLVYLVIYLLSIFLVFRVKHIHNNLFILFIIVTAILLIVNILPILIYEIKFIRPNSLHQETLSPVQYIETSQRDIYYIVLDAYARQDILKEVLNYDNSAFISALKDRGFYIPDCAFSNYDGTELTISSVLNVDFLQDLGVSGKMVDQDLVEDPNRIINNIVRTYFKQYGYVFVSGRGFSPGNDITDSDIYLNYFIDQKGNDNLAKNRFSALYLNTTLLRALNEFYKQNPEKFFDMPFWWAFNQEANPAVEEALFWYNQNNYIFDSLEKMPVTPGTFLVYAHINAPHGPYVFQSDGSFQYPLGNPLDPPVEKVLYANELTYINTRVLNLVDSLLNDSEPQPIIIIQGDHGIHRFTSGLDKHKILSAYYLPGDLIFPPYATITPVNDFRLIIKNYFDQSYELSPDILYIKLLNDYESVPSRCDLRP